MYAYTALLEKLHNVSWGFKWLYAKCVSCRLCFLWHHICKLTWICTLNTDQSYYPELSKSRKLLIVLYCMCMSVYCSCVRVHACVHSNIVSYPPSPFLPPHLLFSPPFPFLPPPRPPLHFPTTYIHTYACTAVPLTPFLSFLPPLIPVHCTHVLEESSACKWSNCFFIVCSQLRSARSASFFLIYH